jgi:hypothetical protein
MRIGHIALTEHISVAEELLVILFEALSEHGIAQHALDRNPFLGRRLETCRYVTVGPLVRSAIATAFLLPDVDIIHAHGRKAVDAGVLMSPYSRN